MTGQIAGPSTFSLELVGLMVGVSIVIGAVDLIRQPGWAWKRAEESKAAYLILVLLLPVIGLAMYVRSARPKVATIAAAGRAASLPFERFGEETIQKQREEQREDGWPEGTIMPPVGFDTFGATTITEDQVRMVETVTADRVGPPANRMTTVDDSGMTTVDASGTRLSTGWKPDPTGRHQFRYWDGLRWTENVADAGELARDAVSA